ELVPGAAELALRGLDERQAQVARAVEAVEDARQLALGGEDEDAGGVGELLGLVVPAVAEADGVGELPARVRVADQEVPRPRAGRGLAVGLEVALALGGGDLDGVARVEADGQDAEVAAEAEAELARGARDAV